MARDPRVAKSKVVKTPFIPPLKNATSVGARRSYARAGTYGEQFAMITLASSHPLGISNLTTFILLSTRPVAEPLHLKSACTTKCELTSREMKSAGLTDDGDIGPDSDEDYSSYISVAADS